MCNDCLFRSFVFSAKEIIRNIWFGFLKGMAAPDNPFL